MPTPKKPAADAPEVDPALTDEPVADVEIELPDESEEVWKEQEVIAGPEDAYVDPDAPSPADDQSAIDYAETANLSGSTTVSESPDGSLAAGLSPDSVVISPAGIPAPVNAHSTPEAYDNRVSWENQINADAELFATSARAAYIEAAVAGTDPADIRVVVGSDEEE